MDKKASLPDHLSHTEYLNQYRRLASWDLELEQLLMRAYEYPVACCGILAYFGFEV
jgi:hypothetical protein